MRKVGKQKSQTSLKTDSVAVQETKTNTVDHSKDSAYFRLEIEKARKSKRVKLIKEYDSLGRLKKETFETLSKESKVNSSKIKVKVTERTITVNNYSIVRIHTRQDFYHKIEDKKTQADNISLGKLLSILAVAIVMSILLVNMWRNRDHQ